MTEAYDGRQVVGIDLHRRRSVIVRMTEDGRKLETVRITNSPAALRAVIAKAGENPRMVMEATYGWYWAADVLEEAGAEVHLAHPLGVKAYSYCAGVAARSSEAHLCPGCQRCSQVQQSAKEWAASSTSTSGPRKTPAQHPWPSSGTPQGSGHSRRERRG